VLKYTTVKYSEIAADPTHRLDAAYWIAKQEVECEAMAELVGVPCAVCHGKTHHEDGCTTLALEDRYPEPEEGEGG